MCLEFTVLNVFFHFCPSAFRTTCTCPEKQILPWKFSLHWIQFLHSGFLSNLGLPWKTECDLNSLYWIYVFYHSEFWTNLRLPWKTEFALKFFTALKYFLSFRIFEQLDLALKTEFALNFSNRGGRPPRTLLILTPCTSIQRKRTKKGLPNISSCWTIDIPLFDFYRKLGLGPDQSHYNQSRRWSWLQTTRAQITRIAPKWIYTAFNIFSQFTIFVQLSLAQETELPWKFSLYWINWTFYIQDF